MFFLLLAYNYSFLFLPWWQLRELWLELVSVVPEGKQGGNGEHDVTVVLETGLAVPYLRPWLC